jgi:hypothetical protein
MMALTLGYGRADLAASKGAPHKPVAVIADRVSRLSHATACSGRRFVAACPPQGDGASLTDAR